MGAFNYPVQENLSVLKKTQFCSFNRLELHFQNFKFCVGRIANRAATPSILSTDPASVIIWLGFWPWVDPQLLMLFYKYSDYPPFNTRLLPVTYGITNGRQPNHSLYFEFSNALEIFSNPQDLNCGLCGWIFCGKPQLYHWAKWPFTNFDLLQLSRPRKCVSFERGKIFIFH